MHWTRGVWSRPRPRRLAKAAVVALAGLLPACEACSPCPDEMVRRDGECVRPCNLHADCTRAECCLDGLCEPSATCDANAATSNGPAPSTSEATSAEATSASGTSSASRSSSGRSDTCSSTACGASSSSTSSDASSSESSSSAPPSSDPSSGPPPTSSSSGGDSSTSAGSASSSSAGVASSSSAGVASSSSAGAPSSGADACSGCPAQLCCGAPPACQECCAPSDCGTGAWRCNTGTCVCPDAHRVCGESCAAPNACGGCAALPGGPGDGCGDCGHQVCTADNEGLRCVGDHAPTVYYHDGDDDGFGVATASESSCSPSHPYDAVSTGDCNDSNRSMFPGAPELCDGMDNDCETSTPDGQSCAGGASYCCDGSCQECCTANQCGSGAWGCRDHVCSCARVCYDGFCAEPPNSCCDDADCPAFCDGDHTCVE